MDFESPDVEKDFPGLYASEATKKNQARDSDYSDEEKISKKDLLIGKRRERKESKKDKGYVAFEGESSDNDMDETKSPGKSKKNRPTFKFPGKDKKEKHGRIKEKEAKEKREKEEGKEKQIKSKSKEEKKQKKEKNLLKLKDYKKKKCTDQEASDEKPVFGVPLHEAVERNHSRDGIDLPVVVRECIDYIEEHGLACEGIYRISGVKSKVRNLKAQYNRGEKVYLYEHEPHIVASLLKQYLRDLPEPILTIELSAKFEEAASIKNEQKKVEMLLKLIDSLPSCNKLLLSWIFVHMIHVIRLEKRNKMNLQNVSIVLSPTMQISHCVLHALFSHSDVLFRGVEIKKYVPPIESDSTRLSLELPDSPTAIEEELCKQENLLNVIHAELNAGLRDKRKEEQLWEIQRIVTQLKRKLRFLKQVQDASKCDSHEHATEAGPQLITNDFHVDATLQKPTDGDSIETSNAMDLPTDVYLKVSKNKNVDQIPSFVSKDVSQMQTSVIGFKDDDDGIDDATLKYGENSKLNDEESEKESVPPMKNDTSTTEDETVGNQDVPAMNETVIVSEDTELTLVNEVKDVIVPNYDEVSNISDDDSVSLHSTELTNFGDDLLPEKVDFAPCRPSELDLKAELPTKISQFMGKVPERVYSKPIKVIMEPREESVSVSERDSEEAITEDEEFASLLREEQMLLLRREELVMLGDELKRKITSERQEVDRLKAEIKEYQQLYKYKQYSFDSTENSSSESDSSDSDDEDYATTLEDLIKESLVLEQKNKELIKQIQQERETRMDIKVQMKMLQLEIKPAKA